MSLRIGKDDIPAPPVRPRSSTVCISGIWSPSPSSLSCSPSAALLLGSEGAWLYTREEVFSLDIPPPLPPTTVDWVDGQLVACSPPSCFSLLPPSLDWQPLPPLPSGHKAATSSLADSTLYILGGCSCAPASAPPLAPPPRRGDRLFILLVPCGGGASLAVWGTTGGARRVVGSLCCSLCQVTIRSPTDIEG